MHVDVRKSVQEVPILYNYYKDASVQPISVLTTSLLTYLSFVVSRGNILLVSMICLCCTGALWDTC